MHNKFHAPRMSSSLPNTNICVKVCQLFGYELNFVPLPLLQSFHVWLTLWSTLIFKLDLDTSQNDVKPCFGDRVSPSLSETGKKTSLKLCRAKSQGELEKVTKHKNILLFCLFLNMFCLHSCKNSDIKQ